MISNHDFQTFGGENCWAWLIRAIYILYIHLYINIFLYPYIYTSIHISICETHEIRTIRINLKPLIYRVRQIAVEQFCLHPSHEILEMPDIQDNPYILYNHKLIYPNIYIYLYIHMYISIYDTPLILEPLDIQGTHEIGTLSVTACVSD